MGKADVAHIFFRGVEHAEQVVRQRWSIAIDVHMRVEPFDTGY